MKFLLCIILNFFIFSAVSKNCSKEDYETAKFWNNYYDPEEVYKVGLKIQNALKNKDIEKLYSFIDENSNAPRKEKVLKVGFENVFEGKMIENVTSLKPSCSPVGWRGFMLGNGGVWFNGETLKITSIWHNEVEELPQDFPKWVHNKLIISPRCFSVLWVSGDNYEEYEEQYKIENKTDFRNNVGKYFINLIPIEEINSSWGEKISLAKNIVECNKNSKNLLIKNDHVELITENEWGKTFLYYKTLKKVSKNNCSNLAPYLKGTCNSSYLVNVSENSGGTYTSSDYYIYGLFTLNDSSEYLIPLKKFKSDTEGRNYIDSFESK